MRIGSRMGKPRNEASPAGNRALTSDSPEPFLAGRLNGESYRERTSAVTSIPKKCSVDTCDRPLCAKGLCRLHWERQHKTGTTDDPKPRAGLNSMWKGDAATYGAVHLRMSSGPRPDTCEECGASGVRFEWALRADVPRNAIKTSPDGLAYSTDPSHYRNLCARCHNVQDLAKSKCKRGHDRTDPANIYVQPSNGKKFCRACERIRRAERAERARVTA